MQQKIDISEMLIAEQSDEISGMTTISWVDCAWKHLSLIGDEEVISLSHANVYVFSDSVLCLGRMSSRGRQVDVVEKFITIQNFGTQLMVSRWNSSVIFLPRFTTLQVCNKVQEFVKNERKARKITERIIFMSMFNDMWRSQDSEQECESNANLVSICARRFAPGRWSFLGPVSEKKWYSSYESRAEGEWDRVDELMMIKFRESEPSFLCHESSVQRNAKKQSRWKIINTLLR